MVPSARLGVTLPSPVMNRNVVCPALAVRDGLTSFEPSRKVKMPGAVAVTPEKVVDVLVGIPQA